MSQVTQFSDEELDDFVANNAHCESCESLEPIDELIDGYCKTCKPSKETNHGTNAHHPAT